MDHYQRALGNTTRIKNAEVLRSLEELNRHKMEASVQSVKTQLIYPICYHLVGGKFSPAISLVYS